MDNDEHDTSKPLSLSNSLALENSSDQSFLLNNLEGGTKKHYTYDNHSNTLRRIFKFIPEVPNHW